MCSIKSFKIDLKALKEGENTFEYQLADEYFKAIEAPEIQRGNCRATYLYAVRKISLS